MTDTQRIQESIRKDADLRRQVRRVNVFLLLILAALVIGPLGVTWWINRQYPSISTVSLDALHAVGETDLCPGDPLVIEYAFHAAGAGVLVRDATVWQITPPKTVIFSTSRRFILEGPVDQTLVETWHVPPSYVNPSTDKPEPLPPGDYRRIMAISSPNNSIIIAIAGVDFTIREDCS